MHIVEFYFEASGFDFRLLKGGIAVYLWNLSQKFIAAGHRVSIVTASNGQLDYLQQHYPLQALDYAHDYQLPLRLDPQVWGAQAEVDLPLHTRAYHLQLHGVDLYVLDNEMLRLYPETCYPPYELKGRELGFHKPLAFQVDGVRFIQHQFRDEDIVLHAHEPYYQYLLPLAFRADPRKTVISTVQSNMPVNKKVFRPKLERLLELLGCPLDLSPFEDPPLPNDGLVHCMEQELPRCHLHYPYPEGYLPLLGPILAYSDAIDFLSPGQLDFYASFADTPFEQRFQQLRIAELIAQNRHKFFVGWCALSDAWQQVNPAAHSRTAVLAALGLNPLLPTFFHNARYAPEHKGQRELMRAIEAVLASGAQANFIVRCIAGTGIPDPEFHRIQARFPQQVRLESSTVNEQRLMALACAADFGLFPSKFEMDTFLMAQGEAMLCGVVPIATAQQGTRHFEHARPLSAADATGLALPRSFAENDDQLVTALIERIHEAIALKREQPERLQRLAEQARQVARRFTWQMVAEAHLDAFSRYQRRQLPAAAPPPAVPAAHRHAPQLPAQTLRRGQALRYQGAEVEAAEVFLRPTPGAPFQGIAMARQGEVFVAELPAEPADAELYFRLRLRGGRIWWDRQAYA